MLSFLNSKLICQTLRWTDLTLMLFRGFKTPICHLIPHFRRREGFRGHPVLLCSSRTQWLGLSLHSVSQLYLWAWGSSVQPLQLFLDRTVCVSVHRIAACAPARQTRPLSLPALPELLGCRIGQIYESQPLGFFLGLLLRANNEPPEATCTLFSLAGNLAEGGSP